MLYVIVYDYVYVCMCVYTLLYTYGLCKYIHYITLNTYYYPLSATNRASNKERQAPVEIAKGF